MTALKAMGLAVLTFVAGLLLLFIIGVVGGMAGASDQDFVQLFNDMTGWVVFVALIVGGLYYLTRKLAR